MKTDQLDELWYPAPETEAEAARLVVGECLVGPRGDAVA
jgi:hypothetical protein